jgi:hypothetical protein
MTNWLMLAGAAVVACAIPIIDKGGGGVLLTKGGGGVREYLARRHATPNSRPPRAPRNAARSISAGNAATTIRMTCATMAMLIRWIIDQPPNKPHSVQLLLQDALDHAQIATAASDCAEPPEGAQPSPKTG